MKRARLIKVPENVYEDARRRQQELQAQGVVRPLWELIKNLEPPRKGGGFRL